MHPKKGVGKKGEEGMKKGSFSTKRGVSVKLAAEITAGSLAACGA